MKLDCVIKVSSYPTPGSITREHLREKYDCTVDHLFDWFRNVPLCWLN